MRSVVFPFSLSPSVARLSYLLMMKSIEETVVPVCLCLSLCASRFSMHCQVYELRREREKERQREKREREKIIPDRSKAKNSR
jgi:hypothetical protein